MTKEELEKEIKNYIDENCNQWETDGLTADDIVRIAVLDFAEPREMRIVELGEKLANADYQLEGRDNEIRELEKENKVLTQNLEDTEIINKALEKENAELKARVSEQSERISELIQELDDKINRFG